MTQLEKYNQKTFEDIKHSANSKEMYDKKVSNWKDRFDDLEIIEWKIK